MIDETRFSYSDANTCPFPEARTITDALPSQSVSRSVGGMLGPPPSSLVSWLAKSTLSLARVVAGPAHDNTNDANRMMPTGCTVAYINLPFPQTIRWRVTLSDNFLRKREARTAVNVQTFWVIDFFWRGFLTNHYVSGSVLTIIIPPCR